MRFLPFVIFLLLLSCSKEIKIADQNDQKAKLDKMSAFMKASSEVDYKNDYKISKLSDNVPPRVKPGNKEIQLIQKASADKELMRKEYPKVKATLLEMSQINGDDRYTWSIQTTSLKYLRRLFLDENSIGALRETEFLLSLLIDSESVDLDILADAYEHCKESLNSEDRIAYLQYIRTLHDTELKFVKEKALEYKELYQNATGAEKYKYLSQGKDIERRSLACHHARELLNFNTQD